MGLDMKRNTAIRDAEFSQCVAEIRELSLVMYHFILFSTYSWEKEGTASVTLHDTQFSFSFSKDFWDLLNQTERLFLILHECNHIFLDHFARFPDRRKWVPEAVDIANNESLLRAYSFDVNNMPYLWKTGCWAETIIKDKPLLKTLAAEEYLHILEMNDKTGKSKSRGSMDEHKPFTKGHLSALKQIMAGIKNALTSEEGMAPAEVETAMVEFEEKIGEEAASSLRGKGIALASSPPTKETVKIPVKQPIPWARYGKRLAKKFAGTNTTTTWTPDRRTDGLAEEGMFLPSYTDGDAKTGRILVVLFLDTSVSCDHLVPSFMGFAKALPTEVFEVVTYGFSNRSYPIDLKAPKFINSSTSFQDFQSTFDKHKAAKKYAFVFTDGEARKPKLNNPSQWHWFLDKKPSQFNTAGIPTGCIIQCLNDFC